MGRPTDAGRGARGRCWLAHDQRGERNPGVPIDSVVYRRDGALHGARRPLRGADDPAARLHRLLGLVRAHASAPARLDPCLRVHPARPRRRRQAGRRLRRGGLRRRRGGVHGRHGHRGGGDRRALGRQLHGAAVRDRTSRADARARADRRLPHRPRQPGRAGAPRGHIRADRPRRRGLRARVPGELRRRAGAGRLHGRDRRRQHAGAGARLEGLPHRPHRGRRPDGPRRDRAAYADPVGRPGRHLPPRRPGRAARRDPGGPPGGLPRRGPLPPLGAAGARGCRDRRLLPRRVPGAAASRASECDLVTPMTYRHQLPQLGGGLFLPDGGVETVLIFHEGLDLPLFAAFPQLADEQGTERLRSYYAPYVALARERGLGFVLESPTWRASPRWAAELGYDLEQLDRLNRGAIALLEEVRGEPGPGDPPIVISGCIGPQDDGYNPTELLSAEAAQEYHATQIRTFADTAADAGIPAAISFTVETDGRLPSGQALGEAIEEVDRETGRSLSYYMINCAHPTHFDSVLEQDGGWRERIAGLRANASTLSHAELDEAEELEAGEPADLAARYAELRERLPRLNVLG